MSTHPRKSRAAAYSRCRETCQKARAETHEAVETVLNANLDPLCPVFLNKVVDAAFQASLEHGTEKVREALIECEGERIEAEGIVKTLKEEAREQRDIISDLRDEIKELEKELDDM